MNITRENIDNTNAVIKILIEKPDYEKTIEEKLKEYRQKSFSPGFRPGKAPVGLIKKRYGKAILLDEVNKLLSQNLTKYLVEEKLQILGEPLPNKELQKNIDWDKDDEFEFVFDIALAPEIVVPLNEKDEIDYYTIKVSDDMIDQQIDMITSQMGKNVEADEVKEKSLVRGDFVEIDKNIEEIETGIKRDGVLQSVDLIKEKDIKNQFLGKQKGETVIFDPVTAYNDPNEAARILNISKEEAEALDNIFKFTITEILEFEKAEINEDLYKQLFGEKTEIKTEKDFRDRIKNEIASNLLHSSEQKFTLDTREILIEKINPELPASFLKRWLKETNKDVTEDQIESEFSDFLKNLKWQLIKNTIAKENQLKVEEDEAYEFAKKVAYTQYNQYGIPNAPEDQIVSFAKMILEKPEEKDKIYNKLIEDKVIESVKDKITLINKEITQEEFNEMMKQT